jgi:hypothetical protein
MEEPFLLKSRFFQKVQIPMDEGGIVVTVPPWPIGTQTAIV